MIRSLGPKRERGAERPVTADIHRQPFTIAADWQAAIAGQLRRERTLSPELVTFLRESRLLARCCFLASIDGKPLVVRHLAAVTVQALGTAWARSQLGSPHTEDPYRDYAAAIDAGYREAIEGGEPVLNRVVINGLGLVPLAYSQMLFGWRIGERRAVLAAVDCRI